MPQCTPTSNGNLKSAFDAGVQLISNEMAANPTRRECRAIFTVTHTLPFPNDQTYNVSIAAVRAAHPEWGLIAVAVGSDVGTAFTSQISSAPGRIVQVVSRSFL